MLLEYAQKLAAFTHAPPSLTDSAQPPLQSFNVPFPTESNMRRGLLFAQSEEGEEHTLRLELGESRDISAAAEKEQEQEEQHYNIPHSTQQDMQALDGDGDVEFDLLD